MKRHRFFTGLHRKPQLRARFCLKHLNPRLKGLFEMGHMGDRQNAGKISGDRINRGDQTIAALCILGAKAFVYYQQLQGHPRSLSQQPGHR